MNRDQLRTALFDCLREVQTLCGKNAPELTMDTCPFYDLEEFDSLNAVETTELLSARLQKAIRCGKGEVNIFVAADGRTPLNLGQILDRLEALITKSNGE